MFNLQLDYLLLSTTPTFKIVDIAIKAPTFKIADNAIKAPTFKIADNAIIAPTFKIADNAIKEFIWARETSAFSISDKNM